MSVIWQQKTHGVQKRQAHKERTLALVLFVALLTFTLLTGAYLKLVADNVRLAGEVWRMQESLAQMQRVNQALEVSITTYTRLEHLQERARLLGYRPAEQVDYMTLEVPYDAQP